MSINPTRLRPVRPGSLWFLPVLLHLCMVLSATAQSVLWIHQFPGVSRGVAVDSHGNSIISNNTIEEIEPGVSRRVSTLRKLNPFGNVLWETPVVSLTEDIVILAVAVALDGRIAVAGRIGNSFGEDDAYVRMHSSSGIPLWASRFTDPASDEIRGASFDQEGNLYVGGSTMGVVDDDGESFGMEDGFLRKYLPGSHVAWTVQFGTPESDSVHDVATTELGEVYVVGTTRGNLGGPLIGESGDGFLRKYNTEGVALWTQHIGQPGASTVASSVAVSPGGSALVGGRVLSSSFGRLQFVARYSAESDVMWTAVVSPDAFEPQLGVAADAQGHALLASMTARGDLFGPNLTGVGGLGDDAYLQKRHSANGSLLWSVRLSALEEDGTSSFDKSLAVATYGMGNIYLAGETFGHFGDLGSGGGFIARLVADLTGSDINDDVDLLPLEVFKAGGHSQAIASILAEIDELIAEGRIEEAIEKLQSLRLRVDGCENGPSADPNDWITDCDAQNAVRAMIDAMIAQLLV